MNLSFSAEDLEFQKEVRGWIEENLTDDIRAVLKSSATGHLSKELQVTWQQRLEQLERLEALRVERDGGTGDHEVRHRGAEAEVSARHP